MNIDHRKASRLLMALNFVLTGGVVIAGADFFASVPEPIGSEQAFRAVEPPDRGKEQRISPRDYSSVSGARFRTRGQTGRSIVKDVKPGAGSALQNTFRVLGIMLSSNESFNCAILEDIRTREQHTVYIGDVLGSVEVKAIREEEVEVLLYGEAAVLPLDLKIQVREKGRGSSKWSRSGRGSRRGAPKRSAQPKRSSGQPASQPRPEKGVRGSGGRDEVEAHLATLSPDLVQWWRKLGSEERSRWEKWWLGKSPEERKKWESKLIKMAKSRKDK